MGFCVPLQRDEKRRPRVWLLNIHLHFPLYGHNMLGLINFSQRWSSAHHLLWDNHICMPLRIIPLLLKPLSYRSQICKTFKWHCLPLKPMPILVPVVACWHDLVKREMGSNFCLFDLVTCFKGVWRNRSDFVTVFPVIMLSTILQPHQFKHSTCFL